MTPEMPQEGIPTTTWFQRNRSWAIPVGCLGLVVVLGCCGLGGVFLFGAGKLGDLVKTEMAAMDTLKAVVEQRVSTHPIAIEELGEPVTVTNFKPAGYNNQNGEVTVNFEATASGPSGAGNLRGIAERSGSQGAWRVSRLLLQRGGEDFDLADETYRE